MIRNLIRLLAASVVAMPLGVAAQQTGFPVNPKLDGDAIKRGLKKPGYSPYAGRTFPTRLLWGDTHLHTDLSMDARAFGALLGPAMAYRFARGEEVVASHGERIKLSRPYDFLVIADHSDAMGAMNAIIAGNPNLLKDPKVRRWHHMVRQGGNTALKATMEIILSMAAGKVPKVLLDPTFIGNVWGRYTATADRFNMPGRFTALIGYEWTSMPGGNNLHRVVVYRDGPPKADQMLPFTAAQSEDPRDLWKWMAAYSKKTGGQILAIPHNGNLSNGRMFGLRDFNGRPLTKAYAALRIRWEPLIEITQIKGDGETHPLLSPNDEFADYETWAFANLTLSVAKTPAMLPAEYARSALKHGLWLGAKLGVNPYKFGVIGSTDSHTGLSTAGEPNFFGKHSGKEPKATRWKTLLGHNAGRKIFGWQMTASGLMAVWTTENTRAAIFDAMKRKEVYGTTGPRIGVRFFGGWAFAKADARNRLPANVGYAKGVPMGGDLPKKPANAKAPTFLVAALKDPISGNLDRIQIVKGWMDAKGKLHERVYDVVWSGKRKLNAKGKLPPVGNTVDVRNATWTNTIGAVELITVWRDPNFDLKQRAFYYARVIEIPTPRWTAYDAKRFKVKMDKKVPMITRERAYTSPIWYRPR